jgi:uncharacterized membrane protein YedE/YeeE
MLVASGRIAGLSGVVAGLVASRGGCKPRLRRGAQQREALRSRAWRVWFVIGMLGAGAVAMMVRPSTFDASARVPLGVVALAGAVVGVGTRLANGCTSGHGLCGLGRGAKRSLIATLTFFAVGVATATLVGRVL